MHKEFLRLLKKATGRSEHVIAVNLDIRGFTSFCQSVAPLDIATYIKKVYLKIINGYFKNAKYYKPTGDGLILIIPFTEETLKEVTNSTINSCLDLLQRFSSLCKDEPMVNYPTPLEIGIGLTRGSACCLTSEDDSEDKILDYSGRILNLASRLMDIARPSGIVFDDSFGISLLSEETKELFAEETGYVRGVAEENPLRIYYTKKHTLLPSSFKQPLKEPKWNIDTFNFSFGKLKRLSRKLRVLLSKKPLDESKITVAFSYVNPKIEGFTTTFDYSIDEAEVRYERKGDKFSVLVDIVTVVEFIGKDEIPEDANIKIDIIYPVKWSM